MKKILLSIMCVILLSSCENYTMSPAWFVATTVSTTSEPFLEKLNVSKTDSVHTDSITAIQFKNLTFQPVVKDTTIDNTKYKVTTLKTVSVGKMKDGSVIAIPNKKDTINTSPIIIK